ncbi:junctional adhesion molecule 2b isoform X1 [Scophthalmus maximus]|uniref:Junctional adhesion molecule 2b n=1 Tax=Scophthalmus maximus TaxID=52904 RepID=A0A8D3BCT1_SCOMX|nr:junctional adhesion molecule 2b isoform X1 [Scophthalmus maximus]XP_035460289.1 junctional adhesion molecule 2b isoform X1 [Scophthalmus maximus]
MLALPLLITLLYSPVCLSVTVSTSKPKVEVHEHTDAVLACEFRTEKDQNPRIEWKKRGKAVTFVYFNDKFTRSYAGRAQMEGATLTIHAVTQKDSGEYRCEVTASEDHVNLGEASVTLNVLVPPHVPSCEVPGSVFVGSGLDLLCKDKLSVPPATYRWYKDNRALTATADTPYSIDTIKGTLKFKSVSKVDTGMYRCESSNSAGAPKSCVAQQLQVVEYPLNMTILIAGAAGFVTLVLLCCICVCVCRRRGCCKKEKKTNRAKSYIPPPPPPPARNVSDHRACYHVGAGFPCWREFGLPSKSC